MPKRYKNSYSKARTKRKWRQQKLSVGTVAKIAKKVANKLDEKKINYYINNIPHAADGFTWDSVTELVPESSFRPINNGALEAQLISDVGGYLSDFATASADPNPQSMSVYVKGVQTRLCFQNDNTNDVRVTVMIIYIPNLSGHTDDAVDFLRPDVFMLYKRGSGNLLYDGFAKDILRNKATGQASARQYTICASKTFTIPASKYGGQQISDTTGPGNAYEYVRDISQPSRKRVILTKYFKRARKHNTKTNNPTTAAGRPFTDGNYYVIAYSDISQDDNGARSISYCGASSLKIRAGAITGAINP